LYSSLINLKQHYLGKTNHLLAENQQRNRTNFATSLVILICSLTLILITLFQVFKNRRLRKVAQKDTRKIEIKYKTLVEDSGVGLLTTDLNGNITFINKRITGFTGFEREEIIGKHFSSLVEQEWAQMIIDDFKKHFQVKEYEWDIEFPLKVKWGDIIWVEQSSTVLFEDGQPIGFQAILKDITEKRRIETVLKKIDKEREETQFRLQSILDNTPLIIFIKDLGGRYLLANKSYREAFNFTSDNIIGNTDFELAEEEDATRYKEIDEYVIREQKNVEIEETVQQDGVTKNLLIVKFPLFDKDNNLYGIGGIASDITERYLYGMHLIEAKSKAETAEQLQEQFLANMSHEIRTPMNGIIGMTNILMSTPLNEEQRDFVNVIKKSSDSLLVLMNDILDLSKIKAGKLRIEKIDFRLRETLEQTINTFRALIKEKGITLRVSVDLDVPDSLTGDPHRLNQILNNLLSNAIKFTSKGEINVEIKADKNYTDEVALTFAVTDTGIGIPQEKLDYIFESFSQAESGTSRKFGGSGLGLAITKKLIEMQDGSIKVSSQPGKGTTFTFTIHYDVATRTVEKKFAAITQENLNQEGLNGKRVLVVEDNEANQKVIFHILQKAGIETDLADNGKIAIQLLEEGFEYDLIIMDLQMPEMDGFETTIHIRQNLKLNMPIIAMTASALRNEKIKCMDLGMNEYLNKPFVPADLFRQLRRFLLKKEPEEQVEDRVEIELTESKKYYSLSHLIELDDVDCLCEVLELYLETTPDTMAEINIAIRGENWDEVYKKSHKIKSSIGILQMAKMMSLISKIESDAKERKNLDQIPLNFEKAASLLDIINPMIEKELQNARQLLVKNQY
jgi:PAS domain S-box-containing protein